MENSEEWVDRELKKYEKWLEREKKNDRKELIISWFVIPIISIIVIVSLAIIITNIHFSNQKKDYYSHKAIVIDNIEYKVEDTEFISDDKTGLVIKLSNGDEIHTNNYKFKN